MKRVLIIITLSLSFSTIFGQSADIVIAGVFKAQKELKTASYTLTRTDTLVMGTIRSMSGNVKIVNEPQMFIQGSSFGPKRMASLMSFFMMGILAIR
jgi:hypothetical protein